MSYSHAIVVASVVVAAAILADRVISRAGAQIETRQGTGIENAVAGGRLWWAEPRVQFVRVHMCEPRSNGMACFVEDVPK